MGHIPYLENILRRHLRRGRRTFRLRYRQRILYFHQKLGLVAGHLDKMRTHGLGYMYELEHGLPLA
jgi:hypothetical protein